MAVNLEESEICSAAALLAGSDTEQTAFLFSNAAFSISASLLPFTIRWYFDVIRLRWNVFLFPSQNVTCKRVDIFRLMTNTNNKQEQPYRISSDQTSNNFVN